jgi:DNA-binding transcriptional LysR family regulator
LRGVHWTESSASRRPNLFDSGSQPAQHPRDLVEHDCINWHPTPEAPPYRREFTENGRDFSVDVRARVLTNDPALNVRLARSGAGLTLGDHHRVRDDVALVDYLRRTRQDSRAKRSRRTSAGVEKRKRR